MTLLVAKNIRKRIADITILDGVDVTVASGECVALLGPSGSGKSTLLSILGALDNRYEGELSLIDKSTRGCSDRELASLRNQALGFVFQSYNLLGHLSALQNVMMPSHFSPQRVTEARGLEVLAQVGLREKARQLPKELSGGEKQRVAIARALLLSPQLLICDEPTGNLDAETGRAIIALFAQLAKSGVALLIATHDEAIAQMAHRVLRLEGGRVR